MGVKRRLKDLKSANCKSRILDEGILIKCQNLGCPDRVVNSIIYFAQKESMDIRGLSSSTVSLLGRKWKIKYLDYTPKLRL